MSYQKMTVPQLDAYLDDLNQERLLLRERIAQIRAIRDKKIREEHLDYWGLNEGQYEAAKARARSSGVPAHVCLNEARKEANRQARDTQTALAEASAVGLQAKGV